MGGKLGRMDMIIRLLIKRKGSLVKIRILAQNEKLRYFFAFESKNGFKIFGGYYPFVYSSKGYDTFGIQRTVNKFYLRGLDIRNDDNEPFKTFEYENDAISYIKELKMALKELSRQDNGY